MKPSIPRPENGSSPLQGPGFSRRGFLQLTSGGLVASWFLPAKAFAALEAVGTGVTPRATAKNAILVFLPGAPSQIDTWDLKEGSWTPEAFKPASFGPIRFPQGLLPKLADRLSDISLVRSYQSWALVHDLAQVWSQISRNPTGALGSVAPHLGAVVALELEKNRDKTRDVLPGFIALNTGSLPGSGYFPSTYSPFSVQPSSTGLTSLSHPDGAARFALRYSDIEMVDKSLRTGQPLGKAPSDMANFYTQAKALIDTPEVNALFSYSTADYQRYGNSAFGGSCLVAKKLLAGRRGARFIHVSLGGWDMHSNIYATTGASLFSVAPQLDNGLGALIDDLKATPGEGAGKTLYDETIVLVAGEFGRTVGALNGQNGRDHFMRTSVVLFGGGIKPGRVIGETDATGSRLLNSGWSGNRDIRPEDIAATVYSALGIDWTTVRMDDPIGRGFEYVPYAKDGTYKPVDELF